MIFEVVVSQKYTGFIVASSMKEAKEKAFTVDHKESSLFRPESTQIQEIRFITEEDLIEKYLGD